MDQLTQFIDNMYAYLSELGHMDVEHIEAKTFRRDTIDYLKQAPGNRFDHRNICVYYVRRTNQVWVENLN